MANLLSITKKEITDVVNSKILAIMVAFYIVLFVLSFFTNICNNTNNSNELIFVLFMYSTCYYSTLVAMALGYSSFFSEMDGKAINTLLTKPLYRDTIINGKLLSGVILSTGLFIFTTLLYVTAIGIYFNDPTEVLPVIFNILPLMFVLSLSSTMFFYSLTLLICTALKDQMLSFFTSCLSWIILFYLINDDWFAGYISYYLNSPSVIYTISSFSPFTLVNFALAEPDIIMAITTDGETAILKLLLYTGIMMFVTYTVFLRRDVA
ncbi:ABC transporter permease [Methanocella arvoryzae]|nr:ABC transporter permease subunit [Methanocella arvoryzae]